MSFVLGTTLPRPVFRFPRGPRHAYGGVMRILIAEDDPVSRELLRHALAALGHEVTEAADGRAGWEAFQKSPAEVVITAGYKSASFDASALASGVYFYKLDATSVGDLRKSFINVKKMLLIR